MTKLHIDFETRSACELKTAGLHNYAAHPTTSPWCMAFAFGDEEPTVWTPGSWCIRVLDHVQAGGIVMAHNAAFELAIWNSICVPRYGWPVLRPEQVRCTMAMAYSMALPGSLEKAAAAVGIKNQKDTAGGRLMMQLAKPREVTGGNIVWWDEPAKLAALYEYCRQDVRVERELETRLMPLSAQEQAIWVLDQKINNRGIYVDLEAVTAAIDVVTAEADRLNADMRAATGNFVGFTTETARIKKWVEKQGVVVDGVAKNDVLEALADADVPEHVKKALRIRQEAGKSSTAKLRAMVEAASAGSRLRGMFQFCAAATGRWGGRRVQLQNLVRPKMKFDEIERAINFMTGAV